MDGWMDRWMDANIHWMFAYNARIYPCVDPDPCIRVSVYLCICVPMGAMGAMGAMDAMDAMDAVAVMDAITCNCV